MYLCTSGSNRDTISYFPIYMKHCTVSQANNDDHTLYSAPAVVTEIIAEVVLILLLVEEELVVNYEAAPYRTDC